MCFKYITILILSVLGETLCSDGHNDIVNHMLVPGLSSDQFFKDYQTYETINATLYKWANENPTVATFIPSIGKSYENRDIYAFKITNNNNNPDKKSIWFNGGIHAREWIAPATTMFIASKLIEEASTPQVKELLDTFEFHFTPISNPDGYVYSKTNDRYWRKNRSLNRDGSYGVDLNRNWDAYWGIYQSTRHPDTEIYNGEYSMSEPEVQALSKYALSLPNPYGGIDFHAFSQLILTNWAYTKEPHGNEEVFASLANDVKEAFKNKGWEYKVMKPSEMYLGSGTLSDWMALRLGLVALTIELCPDSESDDWFKLPKESIIPCADGAYAGILAFSKFLKENPNIPSLKENK